MWIFDLLVCFEKGVYLIYPKGLQSQSTLGNILE